MLHQPLLKTSGLVSFGTSSMLKPSATKVIAWMLLLENYYGKLVETHGNCVFYWE
jgi:hypothetical protein